MPLLFMPVKKPAPSTKPKSPTAEGTPTSTEQETGSQTQKGIPWELIFFLCLSLVLISLALAYKHSQDALPGEPIPSRSTVLERSSRTSGSAVAGVRGRFCRA